MSISSRLTKKFILAPQYGKLRNANGKNEATNTRLGP